MNRTYFAFTLVAALAGAACSHHSRGNEAEAAATSSGSHRVAGCSAPNIVFEQGSADLDSEDRESLRSLAQCLNRHEIDTLFVVGRTDPVGTPGFNLELGRRRAATVATYLQSAGATTTFTVRSRGENGASNDGVLWPAERSATITTGVH